MLASLLPQEWFEGLSTWLLLLIASGAIGCVIRGADWLVEALADIASHLGVAKIIIGATIMSLGTTAPEVSVSVLAAWSGKPGLALGNGIGSIIADTGLIFGLCCLLTTLPTDRFVLSRQGWLQFGSAMMLAVACYGLYWAYGLNASLGLEIGLGFLLLLIGYLYLSVRWSRMHHQAEPHLAVKSEIHLKVETPRSLGYLILMGLIGLTMVIVAGDALVGSASQIALSWGIPENVIAATLIALGTSLPELVVGVTAIRKGHPELLVGNVIGADILNVLFVIGASAVGAAAAGQSLNIVETLPDGSFSYMLLTVQLPTMLLILGLFRIYIARSVHSGHFSRWMGGSMLALYALYLISQYGLATRSA